jgi:hypothetical protein
VVEKGDLELKKNLDLCMWSELFEISIGLSKKEVAFSEANQNSLPMMFGSNLKRREVIRCLADAFGGCSAEIRRLGKKIEFWSFDENLRKSPTSYLFTKSTDPCLTTSKRIRKASTPLPSFQISPKHHRH